MEPKVKTKKKSLKTKSASPKTVKTRTKTSGAGFSKVFKNMISKTKKHLRNIKPKCKKAAIELAIAAAKELASELPVEVPRVIPVPKTGGVLPLIPIFAGLAAAGSLAGGPVGVLKAINAIKSAKKLFQKESHEKLKSLCIGSGLHIKPYGQGLGIYSRIEKN